MGKQKSSDTWLMRLLISIIGTAIGIGLTFAVNNWRDNRKKEQAQRLMAIMVIHDIDESRNTLETMKGDMETLYNAMMYVRENLGQLDSVPKDTLGRAVAFIIASEEEFRFDMSKEKIFHSSPDTWQNLGSIKFIDNVQSFYFDRQGFQNKRNNSSYWIEPVSTKEAEGLLFDNSNLSPEEYDVYYAKMREFLKEKLKDDRVNYFIDHTPQRLRTLVSMIEKWTRMNNENKFLMSITDEELDEYVHSINHNGIAITEKSLIGTWVASNSDQSSMEWEFRRDYTYYVTVMNTATTNLHFAQGKMNYLLIETGTWAIEGDSLIKNADSIGMKLDASEMKVEPGKQETMDKWINETQEQYTAYYQKILDKSRTATMARLDASHDKLELRTKNGVWYYKRKK